MIWKIIATLGFFALVDHFTLVSVQLIAMLQTDPLLLAEPVTTGDFQLMWWYVGSLAFVDSLLALAYVDFFFLHFRFPKSDYFIGITHFSLILFWLVAGLKSQGDSFFASSMEQQQPSLLIAGVGSVAILILLMMRLRAVKKLMG
jgi:hypothetical protein